MLEHESLSGLGKTIFDHVSRVMVGQDEVLEMVVTCILAGGHLLLEDVPGTGKTTMAKALAKSIGGSFHRVQFTPDLLPSDITGLSIYQPSTSTFEFVPGPVFTHVLLADEINRATPRTQSALLECMEEKQVTEGGTTRPLDAPFFVIATQNPVETQGTFPLPEAQLDRFLMRLRMAFPDADHMVQILDRFQTDNPLDTLSPAANTDALNAAILSVRQVKVSADIKRYMAILCEKARDPEAVRLGPSPRAVLALMRASQAHAFLHGRDYIVPDDAKKLAVPVLAHRILMRGAANGVRPENFVGKVLESVSAPTEE